MAEAASVLIGGLDQAQREVLCFPAPESAGEGVEPDPERTDWDYRPRARRGLSLGALRPDQRSQVMKLVATGVGVSTFASVAAVVALEDVLDHVEGYGRGRHSLDYSVSVFGGPDMPTWSWRFEGHHVSLHLTLVDDQVVSSPQFLGANPATMTRWGSTVVRPVGPEEDLARSLLHALPPPARVRAIISAEAPGDIITSNARRVGATPVALPGVSGADLTGVAGARFADLIRCYLDRLPLDTATDERSRLESAGGTHAVHFAWAGQPEAGQPHYYRLQGPTFLVEYDNTQNGANHVHTVWRTPGRDFGEDLLSRHHRDHHGPSLD